MTKAELLAELRALWSPDGGDKEHNHAVADELLIEYINDLEIKEAYEALEKWYA